MSHRRFFEDLLALAEETSTIDDQALEELGRRVLLAVIQDLNTPDDLKARLAASLAANGNKATDQAID